MKKIFLTTIFLILILTTTACKNKTSQPNENNTSYEQGEKEVKKISEDSIGSKANDFSFEKLDGKKFVLSEQKGKPTLVNIWATWCPPCVGEMPAFERLKNEYEGKVNIIAIDFGEEKNVVEKFMKENNYTFFERLKNEYEGKVNIIAIDFGEEKNVVEKFMKENNYTFDVAFDKKGLTSELYDFQGIPFTFLVDKDGNVANIFRGSRGEEAQYNLYKNAIERVLR